MKLAYFNFKNGFNSIEILQMLILKYLRIT
jgi:hypothetical protein